MHDVHAPAHPDGTELVMPSLPPSPDMLLRLLPEIAENVVF